VGRPIAERESQLGVVLFARTGHGLQPIDMAIRLADSARSMEAGRSSSSFSAASSALTPPSDDWRWSGRRRLDPSGHITDQIRLYPNKYGRE
jgi:DNA-binding transcriptional LysR family regulator